ncbi:hypothetical protein Aph01nite_59220 [Acrocarpospora phusangensis]|uniref:HK97 gp10 family phage protein n=1 Tax=Acrocarpospora phusangensis TaxID=1070424 RepID=A0A919QK15_9ACTN|nr:hypothetical protein [Acrocarpospora phusangensis]GIH27612.1 hypothetical protein Aph01nite_59220 [Acrocarpospora phusangensis]
MGDPIYIAGTEELVALARRLKETGQKELHKELGKAVRKVSTPIVGDLKQAVKAIPVTGSRGRGSRARAEFDLDRMKKLTEKNALRAASRAGLRDTIARAIRSDLKLSGRSPGVKISVKSQMLPQDQRSLPKKLDSPNGWRHPVFGNRENWVNQNGRPWWMTTIKPHADKARDEILDAARQVVERAVQ